MITQETAVAKQKMFIGVYDLLPGDTFKQNLKKKVPPDAHCNRLVTFWSCRWSHNIFEAIFLSNSSNFFLRLPTIT